ncbi:otoferlin-like [Diaphorina citri]|uniref:Otoferlin-like n=1 Tax=Diaphorina citri TaxID=121845 RepID=A0A3Q0JIX5_DIACI|nr:otoferlin-like [Diaphorina citri]
MRSGKPSGFVNVATLCHQSLAQNSKNLLKRLKNPRNELELVPEFEHFADVLQTFDFYYGKLFSNNKNTLAEMKVGSFKGNVMFYPADRDHLVTFSGKPLSNGALQESIDNEKVNVTIRVYIVRAYGLHPKDKDGKCDPYIVLKTGSVEINDRENYVTNQINPYFGRHFEIQGSFPTDAKLTVEIKDHDSVSKDDYIGMTEMDLESRFYSRHRGSCGLARNYTTEWRDQLRPSQILEELCDRHEIGYPVYFEKSVVVGSRDFELPFRSDGEDFREELALYALRSWHQVITQASFTLP